MFRDKLRNNGNSLQEIHKILEKRYKEEEEQERRDHQAKLKKKREAAREKCRQEKLFERYPLLNDKKILELKALCSPGPKSSISIAGYCPSKHATKDAHGNSGDYLHPRTSGSTKGKTIKSIDENNNISENKSQIRSTGKTPCPQSPGKTTCPQSSGKNSEGATIGQNAAKLLSKTFTRVDGQINNSTGKKSQPRTTTGKNQRPSTSVKKSQKAPVGPNSAKLRPGTSTRVRPSTADPLPTKPYSSDAFDDTATSYFGDQYSFDFLIHNAGAGFPFHLLESVNFENSDDSDDTGSEASCSSSKESFMKGQTKGKKKKRKEQFATINANELLVVWSQLNNNLGTHHHKFLKEFPGCLFVRIISAGQLVDNHAHLPGALALIHERVFRVKGHMRLNPYKLTYEYDLSKEFRITENDMLLVGRD